MVTRLPCPWVLSEDGAKVIKVMSYYVTEHINRFAKVGAKIGVMFWLIQAMVLFYFQGHFGVSLWLLFFLVLWGRTFFKAKFVRKILSVKYILPAFVIVSGIHAIHAALWDVMLTAWKTHLISIVTGSCFGVFPGMIMGYFVGVIRNKKQNPPHDDPTGSVWIKGLLLPVSVLSILFILYTRYTPGLSEILNVTPK
jgi:hypothetical protein